jgi:hypothetical protein
MEKISAGKFHFEPSFTSFDYLVSAREQRRGYSEAERLSGRQIDDEIELCRLLCRNSSSVIGLQVLRLHHQPDDPSKRADHKDRYQQRDYEPEPKARQSA